MILFQWYDDLLHTAEGEGPELIVMSHVTSVVREDVGTEDESLSILVDGRLHITAHRDTIERFMTCWELR